MKLTLIAENSYRLTTQITENKAKEMLEILVSTLLTNPTTNISSKRNPTYESSAVPHTGNLPKQEAYKNTPVVEKVTVSPMNSNNTQDSFITNTCKTCGGETFRRVAYNADSEILFKCHFCGEKEKIEKITTAYIKCCNCESQYSTKVMNDTHTVNCKDCKSPIDLVYNDKKRVYESININ